MERDEPAQAGEGQRAMQMGPGHHSSCRKVDT